MKHLLFLITSFTWLACGAQKRIEKDNPNINEFYSTIRCLQSKIYSLPNYIVDTSKSHWFLTDPSGYYSFEGWTEKSEKYDIYVFKLRSYIYANDYFEKRPEIKCSYLVNGKTAEVLELNCGSDSFDDKYPFSFDSIKVAYLEKTFSLIPSKLAVFEKSFFEERYVVKFKDGSIKRYKVDPVHRDFRLLN